MAAFAAMDPTASRMLIRMFLAFIVVIFLRVKRLNLLFNHSTYQNHAKLYVLHGGKWRDVVFDISECIR